MSAGVDGRPRFRAGPLTVLLATAAAVGVGVIWVALSLTTGLIFHFMPAAPMIAPVLVRRASQRALPIPWSSLAAHIAGGFIVAVAAAATIASDGLPRDADELVTAVMLAGLGLAAWLGRRSS